VSYARHFCVWNALNYAFVLKPLSKSQIKRANKFFRKQRNASTPPSAPSTSMKLMERYNNVTITLTLQSRYNNKHYLCSWRCNIDTKFEKPLFEYFLGEDKIFPVLAWLRHWTSSPPPAPTTLPFVHGIPLQVPLNAGVP
jgi:hypothetical protein